MKKFIKIVQLFCFLSYFPVVMAFVSKEKSNITCQEVKSVLLVNTEKSLISEEMMNALVRKTFQNLEGVPVSDINKHEMEERIKRNAVVEDCNIFTTPGGVVYARVKQRDPLLRVFSNSGTYYMDKDGNHIPIYQGQSAHVLVANGYVESMKNDSSLRAITSFIESSRFWSAQIEQIYVTEREEFVLIPRVGSHQILFGSVNDMEEKFKKLEALYKNGWELREWNAYKSVNLKYKGQIICTKVN